MLRKMDLLYDSDGIMRTCKKKAKSNPKEEKEELNIYLQIIHKLLSKSKFVVECKKNF